MVARIVGSSTRRRVIDPAEIEANQEDVEYRSCFRSDRDQENRVPPRSTEIERSRQTTASG